MPLPVTAVSQACPAAAPRPPQHRGKPATRNAFTTPARPPSSVRPTHHANDAMVFPRYLLRAAVVAVVCVAFTATAATATTVRGSPSPRAPPPSPPALRPMGRQTCARKLPGCEVELLRFEEDYVKYRCLPLSASSWLEDLAKDTLEVFKDVEKASCCVSDARNAALTANIATLEVAAHEAGLCAAPYTSIPDYSAGAFQCHSMAECDDVLEDFEDDYVKHECMPPNNAVHDEFAKSLLEYVHPTAASAPLEGKEGGRWEKEDGTDHAWQRRPAPPKNTFLGHEGNFI